MTIPETDDVAFADYLALVEEGLEAALPTLSVRVADLHAAMRYGVFPGGKRIRPLLVLAVTKALGGDVRRAVPAAVAIELLHCYTLIHDDLPCMDNDVLRRGLPTCHVRYGEATALLAGDGLLTLAFREAARALHAPARVVQTLAQAAGAEGVIAGQAADLAALAQAQASPEDLAFIHANKTAALFRCAAEMGVLAAERDTDTTLLRALQSFGFSLGMAFQYIDDLLDAGVDTAFSSIAILGEDNVRGRADRFTRAALRALDCLGPDAEPLRRLAGWMLNREV